MKKLFNLLFLLYFSFVFLWPVRGQSLDKRELHLDSLVLGPTGFPIRTFQVNAPNIRIYKKALGWVNKAYKNPDKVIVGKVEGQSLTINGVSTDALSIKGPFGSFYFDWEYHIYIQIEGSLVTFKLQHDYHWDKGKKTPWYHPSTLFKGNGEYKKSYNTIKSTWEETANGILFGFYDFVTNTELTSEEALSELEMLKRKLDLGLITTEEYESKKLELIKYIK
jgi:hypothetical protein